MLDTVFIAHWRLVRCLCALVCARAARLEYLLLFVLVHYLLPSPLDLHYN